MKVVVLGAGYVGLVTAACLAEFGHDVLCIDHDPEKIAPLRQGKSPVYEPGLEALVAKNLAAGRLLFSEAMDGKAVRAADAVFIAVGTPALRGDGHADLSYVEQAVRGMAEHLSAGRLTAVVSKSTVPVGSSRMIARRIAELNPAANFVVCANPEFLRQGSAISDFMQPDRLVLGFEDAAAAAVMRAIYQPLLMIGTPILETGLESAELVKYAANGFLAARVAFINEIADLCEQTGADVADVARGLGLDSRIGGAFLQPGPGYGGSCFPKDAAALLRTAEEAGAPLRILVAVVDANERRKQGMAARVIAACGGDVRGRRIAVLGVTFKPGTDDMRASVALDVIPDLQDAGAVIRAYDPAGMKAAAALLDGVFWARDAWEAVQDAEALVILAEWDEFRALDLARVRAAMAAPVLVDLRNIFDPAAAAALGFSYSGVGRGSSAAGYCALQPSTNSTHGATRSRQR